MKNIGLLTINRNTRITALLAVNQEAVIEALAKLNRNFSKLRNPILRNLFARRISIEDACRIAHCEIDAFLSSMEQIGFCIDEKLEEGMLSAPETIDFSRHKNIRELDVRPYLDQDIDPLKEILKLAGSVKKGECIKIINSFEPVPLINLLHDQGFLHQVEVVEENLVITWFEKREEAGLISKASSEGNLVSVDKKMFDSVRHQFSPEKIRCIDVRQLEMPQPMLRIIANLEELATDELLYVQHKKLPVFLIPELTKRGLTFLIHYKSDQELELLIYKS